MQAVIYCRVSTKEQVENLSLATQRRACEDLCRREGWDVAAVFIEEGESAKTADRTELQRMLAFCRENKKRVGFVVVYNLSRFSRNASDHHALRGLLASYGIKLRSATEPLDDSATGRFMENIFSAVAQLDNDVKSERTRAGMKASLELGRWVWQPPFGFARGERVGPSMTPHPDHAPAVREAFTAFANGTAKEDVLRRLKTLGVAGRGAPRTFKALDRMLRNALYAGRVEMPQWGIARDGDFEALVGEAIYDRVQARLAGRAGARTHAKDNPDFPLRRFARCGRCEGQGLTGSWVRGKCGGRYAYYHCRRCGLRVSKSELERAFVDLLARLQLRPEFMRLFKAVVLDVWKQREGSARDERARRERQVAALRTKLDRLAEKLTDDLIDDETYRRLRARVRERIAAAEVELGDAVIEHLDMDATLAFAERLLTDAARLWEHAAPEHKLRLQRVYFPHGLTWDPAGRIQTPVTASAFTEIRALARPRSRVASPTGFEAEIPSEPSSQPVDQRRKDNELRDESGDGIERE
jgi:site-specific DNA recombinase